MGKPTTGPARAGVADDGRSTSLGGCQKRARARDDGRGRTRAVTRATTDAGGREQRLARRRTRVRDDGRGRTRAATRSTTDAGARRRTRAEASSDVRADGRGRTRAAMRARPEMRQCGTGWRRIAVICEYHKQLTVTSTNSLHHDKVADEKCTCCRSPKYTRSVGCKAPQAQCGLPTRRTVTCERLTVD